MNLKLCITLFFAISLTYGQDTPVDYNFGEKYPDRYKYSNLVTISDDGYGGSILVRSYFTGMILKPKGYFIEHYDSDLKLVEEYNLKLKGPEFINGYVANGQLYMLFLDYNEVSASYDYLAYRSPISDFNFTVDKILSIASLQVDDPYDHNYYNRDFNRGFTTTALFDESNSGFVISTHFKKGKTNKHFIYAFNSSLKKIFEKDFSDAIENKNYAFESMAFSSDLTKTFIIAKAYFTKKRFKAEERKFQYELIKVDSKGYKTKVFDVDNKYSEALKPVLYETDLYCVGFYANRKDNRYNGVSFFKMNPNTLDISIFKYNPFSDQFMNDKFGKENAEQVKNLVFKNVSFTEDKSILFNAEEYFVTTSIQANSSGGRLRVERFHYNDIVSVKLNSSGEMLWARNINKSEVTQGDGAYASYSSLSKNNDTFFFISTASENPQLLNNERLVFKQGLSRNRNVFVIQLNEEGKMSYKKIIDDKEARLPLMVSKPLLNYKENNLIFYAKRGSKKQLVNVSLN
ncbi:hypothetical protein [Eudoraea chungangensis]|uniref:hypothetical protein n=1 Tax=Eudoraea chungangensis TaxID=1481905 RepID=UPI0023EC23BC|nr:hypothetical protein [Eudoraea chungangensis]